MSVDQLISPAPGLVAQLTGRLTKDRYRADTVYVDQYSGFGYVHLQKGTTVEETVESKRTFELICRKHGVSIQHYHADNGSFKAHAWKRACYDNDQGLSFSGVNAHHTNGLAERRIRSLQWVDPQVTVEMWHSSSTGTQVTSHLNSISGSIQLISRLIRAWCTTG